MAFIASHDDPITIGIEGTSSFGVGITAAAVAEGLFAVEVIRPGRTERRRLAKSDPIDAYQAARAALGNHRIAPTAPTPPRSKVSVRCTTHAVRR